MTVKQLREHVEIASKVLKMEKSSLDREGGDPETETNEDIGDHTDSGEQGGALQKEWFDEEEASDATSGDGAGGGVVVAAGSLRLRELLRRGGRWDPSPISELFRVVLLALMLSFWARRESMAFCFWLLRNYF